MSAINLSKDPVLYGSDRESEIGISMGPIDQDSYRTRRDPVTNAQGPRQTQRNVSWPRGALKCSQPALARAIVSVSDEVVLCYGATQNLNCGVLQRQR